MNVRGTTIRLRMAATIALLPVLILTLTACGADDTHGTTPADAQAAPAPTDDPVSAVRKVDSVAALLPADARASGTLRVGRSIGSPPGAYYPNGQD